MIKFAAQSDIGKKRRSNQDAYLTDPDCQLYVVADGMGGHPGGTVAAEMTKLAIQSFVDASDEFGERTWPFGYDVELQYEYNVLKNALSMANSKVCQAAEAVENYTGMGASVAVLWIQGNRAFYTHLGDCRVYLLRNGELRQLTEDHTLVQEQLKQGIITPQQARQHAFRHVVTRAVGVKASFEITVQDLVLEAGDRLLLCSDGLSNTVEHDQLSKLLCGQSDLQAICGGLIEAANQAGGEDNVTVITVAYAGDP